MFDVSGKLDFIPITKPDVGEAEAAAAVRVIESGWLTQGKEVAELEAAFAGMVDAPHACAVSNCTSALHLGLLAVGVQPGDEVITVSHSYIATANAIRYCGATPVFVDIEPATFNMDVRLLADAVTVRTRAILCVHQMGMPCDLASIVDFARNRGIAVVEDAACAIGSQIKIDGRWSQIGAPHGDIACFSFHPRKVLTTGDGGMLTTSCSELQENFRRMRQHGMSINDRERHNSKKVVFEAYPAVGYNYRMTDIQAAIGRVQLTRLTELVARRRELSARYHRKLASIEGVTAPSEPPYARSNWQSYCVRLPAHCDQRQVMQFMLDRGVATRRGIMNAHREDAYGPRSVRHPLAESERAQEQAIILPLYPRMSDEDQSRVVETLAAAIHGTARVSRQCGA